MLREDHGNLITALVDWLGTPCLNFVRRNVKELVPTSDSNLAMSLMYLFEMLMHEAVQDEKAARDNKNLKSWIMVDHTPCKLCLEEGCAWRHLGWLIIT